MAAENSGRGTPPGYLSKDEEVQSAGKPLSDFLLQLEDYTPTVRHIKYYRIILK